MGAMQTVDPEHLRGRLIHRAVETLSEGGVIIYPTDTIYGLGCDITNKSAIERIQRIKQRDAKKPMSFVCANVADISTYAHVSKFAFRILQRLSCRAPSHSSCPPRKRPLGFFAASRRPSV